MIKHIFAKKQLTYNVLRKHILYINTSISISE